MTLTLPPSTTSDVPEIEPSACRDREAEGSIEMVSESPSASISMRPSMDALSEIEI